MKILHCISSLVPDGAQRMLVRLLEEMDRSCFQPLVVSLTDELQLAPVLRSAGIPVVSIAMSKVLPSPAAIARLRQAARSFQPDVIQGWLPHGNLGALIARTGVRHSPPLLWNMRRSLYELGYDKPLTQWIIRLNACVSRWPDKIIYCAREAQRTHEEFGFRQGKGVVIGNGFSPEKFAPSPVVRARVREELGLSEGIIAVGIVGRNHPQKDLPNFLRAVALVAGKEPSPRFFMVGRGVNPRDLSIAKLVGSGHLASSITFLEERNDIPEILQGFDIYCSSSRSEGFPNVVAEAMLAGLPCVVTDVGASAELVQDDGRVVPRENHSAFAEAMISLLKLPHDERRKLGDRARVRMAEFYSLRSIADKYQRLYESLVADSTKRG